MTPLRHSNIRSRRRNDRISEARSPLSRLTINNGRRAGERLFAGCVDELLFIRETNRTPDIAPLSKALHLVEIAPHSL